MWLIIEIAAGVTAGIVLAFIVLANWSLIVESVEKLIGFFVAIAALAGISWGIAWVVLAVSGHAQSEAINTVAGNVMAGLIIAGFLAWLLLGALLRFRERRPKPEAKIGDEG